MTQKPPIHSLDSANGPSVMTVSAPVLSTVVVHSIGCRPPANTQTPASCIFSLKTFTASKIGCISSMVIWAWASSAADPCTASRYWVIAVSSCGSGRPVRPLTLSTNASPAIRHPSPNFLCGCLRWGHG